MSRYLTEEQQKELTKACEHMFVYNKGKIGDDCCSFGYMVCVGCGSEHSSCKYFERFYSTKGHCKHPAIYTKLKVGGMLIG